MNVSTVDEPKTETLEDVNKYLEQNSPVVFIALAQKYNLEALNIQLPPAVREYHEKSSTAVEKDIHVFITFLIRVILMEKKARLN